MRCRLCVITLCLGMGSAGAMVAATARAAEPLTLEEIRSQLAKERSQLQNLYIEVTTDYKLAVDPKVYLTLPGHNKNVILVKETSQYAFKGEKHYKRTLCPAVVKSPWPLEPLKGDNKPRDEYHLAPDETVVCTGKLEWERRIMEKGKPSNLFIIGRGQLGALGATAGLPDRHRLGNPRSDRTQRGNGSRTAHELPARPVHRRAVHGRKRRCSGRRSPLRGAP